MLHWYVTHIPLFRWKKGILSALYIRFYSKHAIFNPTFVLLVGWFHLVTSSDGANSKHYSKLFREWIWNTYIKIRIREIKENKRIKHKAGVLMSMSTNYIKANNERNVLKNLVCVTPVHVSPWCKQIRASSVMSARLRATLQTLKMFLLSSFRKHLTDCVCCNEEVFVLFISSLLIIHVFAVCVCVCVRARACVCVFSVTEADQAFRPSRCGVGDGGEVHSSVWITIQRGRQRAGLPC